MAETSRFRKISQNKDAVLKWISQKQKLWSRRTNQTTRRDDISETDRNIKIKVKKYPITS